MGVFLELNGWTLEADEAEVVRVIVSLAAGEMSEADLTVWVGSHIAVQAER